MVPSFAFHLRPRFLLIAVITMAGAFSLPAQPRLVKDINVQISPVGSAPVGLASIGDVTFFIAKEAQTGHELWKTDGTERGTTLVRDIFPGPGSGMSTSSLSTYILGNRLIFVAAGAIDGLELWATDGTAHGTVQLTGFSAANPLAAFGPAIGSNMYFTAREDPSSPRELWQTDGTPAGTRRVLDRNSAIGRNNVSIIARHGSWLLFNGADGTNTGIFATDGTTEGTRFVAPFIASFGASFGDAVLFVTTEDGKEWKLMRTDGTSGGTTLIRAGFTSLGRFLVINGVSYFTGTDPVNGKELWRSDGTIGGTRLVADLTPGAEASQTELRAALGNRVLLATTGGLWISDGTAAGTHMVKAAPYVSGGAVSGTHFYFVTEDATYGRELWKTDGTSEGTSLVSDINPGSSGSIDTADIVPRPGGVLFFANHRVTGSEPWITDGTTAGTRMLRNIAPDTHGGSYPSNLANVGGRLFFGATDGTAAVWMSDGTTEGTSRLDVPGLTPGPAVASGDLYYFVHGSLPALQLWRTDGTVPGTFRLFTMGDSRYFNAMTAMNGGLFFSGSDPQHGPEPWFTRGTVASTQLLKDLYPGTTGGFAYTDGTRVVEEGTVLLHAQGVDGHEVWLTDGTPGGTRPLMLIDRYAWSNLPGGFTKFGDAFFFVAARHGEPLTLWRLDPATGQYTAVRQMTGHWSVQLWNVGDAILFTAGKELWRSDGTEAGTVRIHDAISRPECFFSEDVVVGGGLLFWYAYLDHVPELWRSDGTTAGTFRLGRFAGPPAASLQGCARHHLHYSGDRLYFIGRDELSGAEPWVSDGTLMGTRLLWDINPGPAASDPASFLRIGRTLFFSANEPSSGRELWAMETGCDGECPPRRRSVRH